MSKAIAGFAKTTTRIPDVAISLPYALSNSHVAPCAHTISQTFMYASPFKRSMGSPALPHITILSFQVRGVQKLPLDKIVAHDTNRGLRRA